LVMPMNTYTAQKYIDDVLSGRQVVCKYVMLAVERHLNDLKRAESGDLEFPYYFDEGQAKRVIDFKHQLRHTQGEWANPRKHDTRIRLEPWQQFKDWVLFGWRRQGGYRRFTKAYIEVARKNGKTTDAAATANYCFLMDRPHEIGPEVYCVATKRDQAKKAWDEAERQIQREPFLRELVRTYKQTSTIIIPGTAAQFKPLGKDSHTEDALNPHFALVDEYHAHRDNSMIEVMESALGVRVQTWELRELTENVLFEFTHFPFFESPCLTTRLHPGTRFDVSNSPPVGIRRKPDYVIRRKRITR